MTYTQKLKQEVAWLENAFDQEAAHRRLLEKLLDEKSLDYEAALQALEEAEHKQRMNNTFLGACVAFGAVVLTVQVIVYLVGA